MFNNWLRWSAHYLEFFLLFLILAVWPLQIRPLPALLLCVLLAAADEGHQYFVPDRSCSLFDFELDSAGVLTAFVLAVSVRRLHGRSRAGTAIAAAPGEKASA
jgi:VanZ family protein